MTMQVRLDRQLRITQRIIGALVIGAVSYIAVVGYLFLGGS